MDVVLMDLLQGGRPAAMLALQGVANAAAGSSGPQTLTIYFAEVLSPHRN